MGFASRTDHAFGADVVASSSKHGTFSMYRIAGLEQFDIVLSDDVLPPTAADGIRKQGVELLLPLDTTVA